MKNFSANLIYISLILFFPVISFSQQISGVIINENKIPVESVNIVISPLNKGTVTNLMGQFEFNNIPKGKYVITVSMVGYISQSINISTTTNNPVKLNIVLKSENKKIEEVKVVGNYQQFELLENPTIEQSSLMPTITKISGLEIKQQGAVSLIEALKFIPGGWTETRGRKVKQFFSIRGQKYPYPSYSINGIWQKEFSETPYFFNSTNIKEVKIIRSSSALIKSLSALAGVVDVTTKMPSKKEAEVTIKYGSLNTYQTGLSFGNKSNKLSYMAGINGFGTNGIKGKNGKEQIWNGYGFADWKINKTLDLSVNLFYITGKRQLVQPIEPANAKFRNNRESYEPLNTLMVSSKLKFNPAGNFSSELHLNYADRKPTYRNENLSTGKITKYNESDYEITINQINTVALGAKNTFRFGSLYNYWLAPNGKRFYYGKKAEVHTFSGVITDQHNFGKLLVDAGLRLTQEKFARWGSFNIEGSSGKFTNVEPITDEWQSPTWQATAGGTYTLTSKSSLHVSIAGGIVTPRNGALNNEGLKPENEFRTNYDFGFIKQFSHSGNISLTTFLVNRNNAIEYSGKTIELGESEIMELYQNTNKRNYGIELEIKSPVYKNTVSMFTNFTLMKGEIDSNEGWKKDDEMPQFIANLGANYQKNKIDVNGYANYTGAYKNDRFVSKTYLATNGKAPLGNFLTLDFTAGYTFGKNSKTRFFLEGKNLLNKKYQTVPGYPDNGRLVSAGFNIKI